VIVRARIVGREPAAAGQVRVSLEVGAAVRAAHERAGQFVGLFPGTTDRAYFALLNAPGEGERLELLVRTDAAAGGEAAARLLSVPVGDEIETTTPMGTGFPLERAVGKQVRVVATGTAIGPARAAMVVLLGRGDVVASLDYGVRSPGHVAIRDELARMREGGVEIAVHLSEPTEGRPTGTLAQDELARRWSGGAAAREIVVAVGHPAMVAEVRERWLAIGGDERDVLTNG
jgi:NAD(P)H-flavin reductase